MPIKVDDEIRGNPWKTEQEVIRLVPLRGSLLPIMQCCYLSLNNI